jgi:hypothetical protein
LKIKVRGLNLTFGDTLTYYWSIWRKPDPLRLAWLHAKRIRTGESPATLDRQQVWKHAFDLNLTRHQAEEKTKVTTAVNALWKAGYRLHIPNGQFYPAMREGLGTFFLWQEQPVPINDHPDQAAPLILYSEPISLDQVLTTLPAEMAALFPNMVQEDAWDTLIWLSWRSRHWLIQNQELIPK